MKNRKTKDSIKQACSELKLCWKHDKWKNEIKQILFAAQSQTMLDDLSELQRQDLENHI